MNTGLTSAKVVVAGLICGLSPGAWALDPPGQNDPIWMRGQSDVHVEGASRPPRNGANRLLPGGGPFAALSADSMLATLGELTAIGAHSGWRYSTTTGEARAFDFVEQRLATMRLLRSIGLEVQRHSFRTRGGVEFRESVVELTIGGDRVEVPADASPGHRDRYDLALRFDSDGALDDSHPDPVTVTGAPLVIRSASRIDEVSPGEAAGRIVFLDYAVIDRVINESSDAVDRARRLLEKRPAGVVLVTRFSNLQGVSHGSFAADNNAFTWVEAETRIPILNVKLEDLAALGVGTWAAIEGIEAAHLTWDVDLHEVGTSEYLVARIPGRDPTRAMILGAHLDSPNTPGAFDDGSGSVALIEIARVLDRTRTVPPVDLYLVWFGSEERGLYGSFAFTADHSELLDRTIAMLQMDCLGHPLNGIANSISLVTWSYERFGDDRLPWPEYLDRISEPRSAPIAPIGWSGISSDNAAFSPYNVPNANLIYQNPYDDTQVHHANHWHDPYDTAELAETERDTFLDMARVMLNAALQTPVDEPPLRLTPEPDRRAVFVASHTEGVHMTAAGFTEFGMALGLEGFDVDIVPYGRPVSPDDLEDADLVIALPVHDYPSPAGDASQYDEEWTTAELDALEDYVRNGGRLVLTNSAHRLKFFNLVFEDNEDWSDQNALAERFGISYLSLGLPNDVAQAAGNHPLVLGVTEIDLADSNSRVFRAVGAEVVAQVAGAPAIAVVSVDSGEVIVLADLGILGNAGGQPANLQFWKNLARYAR